MEESERAGRNELKKKRWRGWSKTGTMRGGKSNCREQKRKRLKKRVAEKMCREREGETTQKMKRMYGEMEAAA